MSEFFPGIEAIPFAGASASDELVFRRYDPQKVVAGKTMQDQLRFASAYWHTMRNPLSDPFGAGTAIAPWDDGSDSVENARVRVEAFFEFLEKCQINWYCFHDRDVAPEGVGVTDSERILDSVTDKLLEEQQRTRQEAALGNCLPVHSPSLRPRGRDQLPG